MDQPITSKNKLKIPVRNKFRCTFCNKIFTPMQGLGLHVNLHTTEKPYKREKCNAKFVSRASLRQHKFVHEPRIQCEICNNSKKTFATPITLNKHKMKFYCTEEKVNYTYKCKMCSKMFALKEYLVHHNRRKHSSKKPYICSYCPAKFLTNFERVLHVRIHTNEKPFLCKFCPKAFTNASNQVRHEKIHTGEKQYKCAYCPKLFICSGEKKLHERSHTGEKPYKCELCGKTFSSSSAKICRNRIFHAKERSFKCEFCNKAFFSTNHKKRHEVPCKAGKD